MPFAKPQSARVPDCDFFDRAGRRTTNCGRWGLALSARGIQLAIARLGRRAAVGTRCSPHTFRRTFARGYLVNDGDVFSPQQILGQTTLDMVRRYVHFASFETVRRLIARLVRTSVFG